MKVSPILCAALGAAVGFYTHGALSAAVRPRWVLILLLAVAALVSACRVLALGWGTPGFFRPAFRSIHRRALALAAGLILGVVAAAASLGAAPRLGLPVEAVRGIAGVLDEDPRETSNGRGMGYLALQSVAGEGGLRVSARGRVLVFFPTEALPRLREFGRGAEIFVEGGFATGNFAAGGADGLFRARSTHIVSPAPAWEQRRTGVRLTLLEKLEGRSWGGLGAALLLGVKDNLDSDLARKYRDAGCSHVLALSGMHLAIVAALAAFFLRKPLGLKAASVVGAVLILLYVSLIGVQPSLERSAIMYLLGAAAVLGFLPRHSLSLLAMAFVIQIALRPSAGTSLSFTLSYLALAGILTVGEFLHGLLRGRLPEFLASPLAASLGAYLATQAVAAGFGVVRPVGVLAGLVVVPLTTVFMIAVIAALPLSFIAPFLMRYLDMALTLFYALLDRVVSLAALIPGIAANGWARELILTLLAVGLCLCPGYPYSIRRRTLAPFA
ncbi:MAG: ComEC/Rec2 family competence protein [Treponema sp.]|jgi:competence protein ComEC|nr:ComEC/Rec2 family competence protein [Treponema sp.]